MADTVCPESLTMLTVTPVTRIPLLQWWECVKYAGFDYTVIDKWQDANASYVVRQLEDEDGTWYAAMVTEAPEQFHGEYEYEFGTDKPTRSDVENMHINHLSEIDIDRHEAVYGADGNRYFPNEPMALYIQTKELQNIRKEDA